MRPAKLDEGEVEYAIAGLKDWTRSGGAITKTFAFPKFLDGIAWVARVVQIYLDLLNMFMAILTLLGGNRRSS